MTAGVPEAGSRVLLGLTPVTVLGGWEMRTGTVAVVLMPSGRAMVCEPDALFDPADLARAQPSGH